jgi:hypothetical protein
MCTRAVANPPSLPTTYRNVTVLACSLRPSPCEPAQSRARASQTEDIAMLTPIHAAAGRPLSRRGWLAATAGLAFGLAAAAMPANAQDTI